MTARQPRRDAQSDGDSLLAAIKTDLVRLHDGWIRTVFKKHRSEDHPVLGDWEPDSGLSMALFRLWGLIGLIVVVLTYPFLLAGFITRFYVTRIDRYAARVGIIGVVLTSIVVWAALTVGAYLRDFPVEGVLAVGAAGSVATVSAALAYIFSKIDGRPVSILFAYPFGVTAVFLPPVVAALYSEVLASLVFSRSDVLAIWLLDSVLTVGGLNTLLRNTFDLVGMAYVAMWFALAVPVGWILGLFVAFADLIRPTRDSSGEASPS